MVRRCLVHRNDIRQVSLSREVLVVDYQVVHVFLHCWKDGNTRSCWRVNISMSSESVGLRSTEVKAMLKMTICIWMMRSRYFFLLRIVFNLIPYLTTRFYKFVEDAYTHANRTLLQLLLKDQQLISAVALSSSTISSSPNLLFSPISSTSHIPSFVSPPSQHRSLSYRVYSTSH